MASTLKPLRVKDMEHEFSIGSAISTASSATRSVNRSGYEWSVGSHLSVGDALGVDDGGSATGPELSVTVVGPGGKTKQTPVRTYVVALAIAMLSHGIAGMPSGAIRFVITRTGAGPMFVGMITTLPSLPFVVAHVSWFYGYRQLFRMPHKFQLTFIFTAWMPLAVFAAYYTQSVYVQLGSLTVPFLVVALDRVAFKQAVPRFTVMAIVVSTIGSVVAIFGETLFTGASGLSLGEKDAIGLGLAFLSFVCIALCVVTIRRIGAHTELNTPDMVLVFWVNLGCVFGAVLTFQYDDWGNIWSNMAAEDYAMLFCLCLFYQVFAIIGGYLLLGETFAPVNMAGTGLAVFATFAYVGYQSFDQRKRFEDESKSPSKANVEVVEMGDFEQKTSALLGGGYTQVDEDAEDDVIAEVQVIAEDAGSANKGADDIKEEPIV